MKSDTNRNISCSVTTCAYNTEGNYCSKTGGIQVGTHEANPQKPECTDCLSFKCR